MVTDEKGKAGPTSFTRLLRNSVLALLIGGTAALIAYCLHSWDREEKEVRENLLVQSSFLASASQSFFENVGNGLKPLGQLLENNDILQNPEASRGLLEEFRDRYPEIVAMAVFTPEGVALINTSAKLGEPLPDFRNDPPYLKNFLADMVNPKPYVIGSPEFGKVIKRWRFTIRRVMRDKNGRPRFLMQAAIPLEKEGTFLHQLPIPPQSFMGLLRNDGYQQARWPIENPSAIYGKISDGPVAQAVRKNPGIQSGYSEGESYWTDSKGSRVGGFTRLARADMYAYVSAPWSYVWQQWWIHNAAVLILSMLFLLATAAGAHRIWIREKTHRHELISQARRDALTGLPNRAAAEEMIQFCINTSNTLDHKFSLLFIDMDRFKDINDSLGHALGDRLLIKIAGLIRAALRDDGMLSRLGGDEFLVVLPGRNVDTAVDIAELLIGAFKKPFQVGDHTLQLTPSIGIAQYPEHGDDIDTLLKHADTAMYEAKRQGRNAFSVYMDQLGEQVLERVEMENLLRQALERNLFRLYYQPVVDMKNGRVVGAEALLRWVREDGLVIMPQSFIGIAEESGLIHPMGEWVLRNALEQVKAWNDAGHDLWVSINISPRQFKDPNLIDRIQSALNEIGVDANQLGVEITETVAMLNPEESSRILGRLKEMGIRIAIDDFGTGYSSLSYLKRIPADKVKIDKSFVDGINQEVDDTAIVHTILALADILGKQVVAEGVETEDQYIALNGLHCDLAQGYWLSRPVPPDDFTTHLGRSLLNRAA